MNKYALLNYSLNKMCPLGIIIFLLFTNFTIARFEPYVIIALIFFIERFNYKVGYSVAICEERNLIQHD